MECSWRRVVLDNLLDLGLVCSLVLFVKVVGFCLGRGFSVDLIEEHLNTEQDRFDCDRRLPSLLFIQDRQANCARGIDVRVE